jgi:hypothetical protein
MLTIGRLHGRGPAMGKSVLWVTDMLRDGKAARDRAARADAY